MKWAALLLFAAITTLAQVPSDPPWLQSTSSLRVGLAGYWRLEEASGTRYDFSKNGNHLTSNNSVGQAAGKVGNCATFVKASSQTLSIADNSSLRAASPGLTVACWVKLTTIAGGGAYPMIMGKGGVTSGKWEYLIDHDGDVNRFAFVVGTNATTGTKAVTATSFGAPATNTWYFVCAGYDLTNLFISVNNGTVNTAAFSGSINTSTSPFKIGSCDDANTIFLLNGAVDEPGKWNRALTAAEKTQLYNGGLGTHFPWAHP